MSEALLDKDTEDTVRLSQAEAQALGEAALQSIGYTSDEARKVTEHLVDASLWGYEFAGLPRIITIAERPETQHPRQPVTIVKETPVSALLDGGNHSGYYSSLTAVEVAIAKARQSGVAIVGVRNSWFNGRNAYYAEKIARQGFAVVYFGSSQPSVVPPGAKQKILGTNPLTIALPGEPDPLIYDIGTSAVMSGEVNLRAFLGESFSEVLGIDKNGTPTASARELKEGGFYPFGGHKGYGLSLMIQAMGLIAGAKFRNGETSDFAALWIVFDPGLLMPREQFVAELAELLDTVRNLPKQPGVKEIRIPSERGFRDREIRRKQGILVKKTVVEKLRQMVAGT
jgi:LDH2 family malate/lactate/ureidoglycolate dehydrogenase